jgi:flagellar biosynthesis protein FliR
VINLSQLNEIQLLAFGLIMLRMMGFIFSASIFSAPSVPIPARILLSVVLTMMVFSSVSTNATLARLADNQNQILILSFLEVTIGLTLGFLTRLFFFAISMAGELISIALGLGQAQIFNPLMGSSGNAMEQFFAMFATLIFFALNGHHIMVQGLIQSFSIVELANIQFNAIAFKSIVHYVQEIFIVAIQLSAPIVISMLVIQVGVGLLSRAVPQINVLQTSSSVTALIGLILLMICLPLMSQQMDPILHETSTQFFKFLKGI